MRKWFKSLKQSLVPRIRHLRSGLPCVIAAAIALFPLQATVLAQESAKKTAPETEPAGGLVQLKFPEQVELKLLVDYVSSRLNVKILFDESVANKKITIKAPGQIPAESLLDLLESALKMKGLALVDADVPGWKRIVSTSDLSQISQPRGDQPLADFPLTTAVTQVFALKYVDPQRVSQIIKPFLTQPGANTITVQDQNLLIVTDYADNLARITQLIEVVDRSGPETKLEFCTAQHVEAATLAQQISQAMATRGLQVQGVPPVQISQDERTNQLLIVGTETQVKEAVELARVLDVPLGLRTEIYSFRYVDAARIDQLVKELFDPLTIKRLYRSAVDQSDNLLVVTATSQIHERIGWLREQLDLEAKRPGSAVKFYRLKHADAAEVLATIQAIEQNQQQNRFDYLRGVSPLGRSGVGAMRYRGAGTGYSQETPDQLVPGPNLPPVPAEPPPTTPALVNDVGDAIPFAPAGAPEESFGLVTGNARVTVDPSTNTIIVVADRSVQQVYQELIEYLDRRPPQVMVEAKVVIIDTSDSFSLGVEYSVGDRSGLKKLFEFTQFGLSTVDPVNGALSIIPGRGLNFVLVNPEEGDAILRALVTHKRARLTSSPRVLVNDNATGTLASVQEVPFTSINASNTVATTSFAGFAEAGTTIEVTPRISDDDHLQLDYVVSLNSFTGPGGDGVPPPRQTDEVTSSVTIPDGYTVIVGGLTRQNWSHDYDGIPFLELIPGINELTGVRVKMQSQTTLYVFLKPTILRDDKFRDLEFLSDRDLSDSCTPGNYPESCPQFVD